MAEATLDIKYWGNNLGVRIPASVAKEAHLHANQKVTVSVENGKVVITPLEKPETTLEERLELFDPEKHGGEVMNARPEGVEIWQ